jgi:hypothetical protein
VALSPLTMPSSCGSSQPGQPPAPGAGAASSGGQVSIGTKLGGARLARLGGTLPCAAHQQAW